MLKDAVIAALAAALIQPVWIVNAIWEILLAYGVTFSVLFCMIVELEEWIGEWWDSKQKKEENE